MECPVGVRHYGRKLAGCERTGANRLVEVGKGHEFPAGALVRIEQSDDFAEMLFHVLDGEGKV